MQRPGGIGHEGSQMPFSGTDEVSYQGVIIRETVDDPVPRGPSAIDGPASTGYPAFAGYDSRYPACFPSVLAPNRDREIGGGRATRQPGQVRKEAALTRSGSGRSSVSYRFFERIAPKRKPVLCA